MNYEKEQLKNKALDDTISELRRKLDSQEIEKTGKFQILFEILYSKN